MSDDLKKDILNASTRSNGNDGSVNFGSPKEVLEYKSGVKFPKPKTFQENIDMTRSEFINIKK